MTRGGRVLDESGYRTAAIARRNIGLADVGLRRDIAGDEHLGPNAKRRVGANGGLLSTSRPLS